MANGYNVYGVFSYIVVIKYFQTVLLGRGMYILTTNCYLKRKCDDSYLCMLVQGQTKTYGHPEQANNLMPLS